MPVNSEILLQDLAYAEGLVASPAGDFDVVSGMTNLNAALLRRILTIPGTVLHQPTYGAGLLEFQGAPMSISQQQLIANRIAEQLVLDPRVESVSSVGIEVPRDNPWMLKLTVAVKVVGQGEATFTYTPFDGG